MGGGGDLEFQVTGMIKGFFFGGGGGGWGGIFIIPGFLGVGEFGKNFLGWLDFIGNFAGD